MKKLGFALLGLLLVLSACSKDDSNKIEPPRDRGEEAVNALTEIEDYLKSHTYNYEDFENPGDGFDFKIKLDSIGNSGKIPLIDMVQYKMVEDPFEPEVEYRLYYLEAKKGGGESLANAKSVAVSYDMYRMINEEKIGTSSLMSIQLDESFIKGLVEALKEFNVGTGFVENSDGTLEFFDYGVGVVFIPSGLAYYSNPPGGSNIGAYNQLIYTFKTYSSVEKEEEDKDDK